MKAYLTLLMTGLYFCCIARQEKPPLLELVFSGIEEVPEVRAASEQVAWFRKNRYGAAFVDEMDVRIGRITDERNDLGIRIKPTNPFLFAAGINLGASLEEAARLSLRKAKEEALYERYTSWLELWRRSALLQQIIRSRRWRNDWTNSTESLIGAGDFDPEELLDIEIEKIDLQSDELEQRDKLLIELKFFLEMTRTSDTIEDASVVRLMESGFPAVSAQILLQRIDTLQHANLSSTQLEEARLDIEQAKLKITMEKMDWDIGFIQPEWETDRDDQFSLRVGIGIPLFRKNRMQMQNRQLDLLENNWSLIKGEADWKLEVGKTYSNLKSLAERINSLDSLSSRLANLQKGISLLEGRDSKETLLKWLKAEEKLENRKLEVQFLLLTEYLDYLLLKGLLDVPGASRYFGDIWKPTTN